jgi:protein-tyrosine-phosphatase
VNHPAVDPAPEEGSLGTEGPPARRSPILASRRHPAARRFSGHRNRIARHAEKLRGLTATFPEKILALPGYVGGFAGGQGIPDPYGHSMAAYRASARQIFECVDLLVARPKGG